MSESTIGALGEAASAAYPVVEALHLDIAGCRVRIQSNAKSLLRGLRGHFNGLVADPAPADIEIRALEAPVAELGVECSLWPREPGKSGPKEAFADLRDGRVVRKVRTGMTFLLGRDAVAIGPCERNINQIVNLVNALYLGSRMSEGGVLCHAAGIRVGDVGIGIAGIGGAGKSTLGLHLMSAGADFVSNDRLIVDRSAEALRMSGVPKGPRINPGTILHNEDLHGLLASERRAELGRMPVEDLRALEEKYDVDVDAVFGPGRRLLETRLDAFVILTWRGGAGATRVTRTRFAERAGLLDQLVKHTGPFVLGSVPPSPGELPPREPYLELFGDLPVLELSGGVDFDAGVRTCLELAAGRVG